MNIYELDFFAQCPNGNLADCYQIKIESQRTIMVELIHSAIKSLPLAIYQEDLATALRNVIGAKITVTGWHHGIKITSIRE
jgi:hypothetical protein